MTTTLREQLLQLTVAVETAMTSADYSAYRRYVEPRASFFEPRSRGTLLQVIIATIIVIVIVIIIIIILLNNKGPTGL